MQLGILTRIKLLWQQTLRWLRGLWRSVPRDLYQLQQTPQFQVIGHDGQLLADDARWYSVSRHGLVRQGIKCPSCGLLAAFEGRTDLIHETRLGEAVHCPGCKAILLASPDDDVDPVKPGEPYDRSVYHAFVRPAGKEATKQRVTSDPVQVGSTVVVVTKNPVMPINEGQTPAVMYGEEVRVERICDDGVVVQAFGNGLGGGMATMWLIPLAGVAVMVQPSLRPGDRLKVNRGPCAGQVGTFVRSLKGKITIETDTGVSVEVIIEHVEKIITNERTY